ncbi:MAG: hypothetical protein ACRC33_02065 [Gemmataceae bacterium]
MAKQTYQAGDALSRQSGDQAESVHLPPLDLNHLRTLTADAGRVRGFHVLPAAALNVVSTRPEMLPAGVVAVLDPAGVPIAAARVRVAPHRVPAGGHDAFEARVEVLDAGAAVIAADPSKSFYPQSWTDAQIQQAVYAAYAEHYFNGGSPFFVRQALKTPQGVIIETRVSGSQSAYGFARSRPLTSGRDST